MAKLVNPINPDSTTLTKRNVIDFLPEIQRTEVLKKFFNSTINNAYTQENVESLEGYIGNFVNLQDKNEFFIKEPTAEREFYQLDPVMVVNDSDGNTTNSLFYKDLINHVQYQNGITYDHARLFNEEYYTWHPPIDLDKFLNYQNYYWLPIGGEPIDIYTYTNIEKDIIGKQYADIILGVNSYDVLSWDNDNFDTYLTEGYPFTLSSGQRIRFFSDENSEYNNKIFCAEFIGRAIDFIEEKNWGYWDETEWSTDYFSEESLVEEPQYLTCERGYREKSLWSLTNRWFHKNVIKNFDDATLIKYKAKRPIIEFEKNLELYNTGFLYRKDADLIIDNIPNVYYLLNGLSIGLSQYGFDIKNLDVIPWDIIEPNSIKLSLDYDNVTLIDDVGNISINGIQIRNGMRILITSDNNPSLNNKVYKVKLGNNLLLLDLETDGLSPVGFPQYGETIQIRYINGVPYTTYWFDGNNWVLGQQYEFSSAPLFKQFDNNRNELNDLSLYPNSSYDGSKIFSYKIDETSTFKDKVLNLKVVKDENDEFVFENYKFTDIINFDGGSYTGFRNYRISDIDLSKRKYSNSWFKSKLSYNPQRFVQKFTVKYGNNIFFLGVLPTAPYIDVNLPENNKVIVKTREITSNDQIIEKTLVQDIDYYISFNSLVLNIELGLADGTEIIASSIGERLLFDSSYFYQEFTYTNQTYFQLYIPPVNNINEETIQIFVNDTLLTYKENYILSDDDFTKLFITYPLNINDVITAKILVRKNPYQTVEGYYELPQSLTKNPNNDEIDNISLSNYYKHFVRSIKFQPNFSGNENGKNNYRDTPKDKIYGTEILQHTAPLLKTMLLSSNTDLNLTNAIRYNEREYVRYKNKLLQKAGEFILSGRLTDSDPVSTWVDELIMEITKNKTKDFSFFNSDVYQSEYYIPPTPSWLGITKTYIPTKFIDTTYFYPIEVIRCHDGSFVTTFNDIRDDILLYFENRIYDSINSKFKNEDYVPKIEILQYKPGKFRTTPYKKTEWNLLLQPMFEKWAVDQKINYRKNTSFSPDDPFSYNYSELLDDNGSNLPGYWRGIYNYYFDTDRPHTHPWEMLGFSVKPSWWDNEYGVAPYTLGNEPLWTDIENGYIRNGERKGTYSYLKRPNLLKYLPIDINGNLLSPIDTGIVNSPDPDNITLRGALISGGIAKNEWKFGDEGPMETAWRRSENYSFNISQLMYLIKPAEFVELNWDNINVDYIFNDNIDLSEKQLLDKRTNNRKNNNLPIYSENNYKTIGIQNWICETLKNNNIDITLNFGDLVRNLNVKLGHKVSGFMNQSELRLISDNFGLIPTDDIDVLLYKSPATLQIVYSGVVIVWNGTAWKIYGYDISKPSFNTIPGLLSGKKYKVAIGSNPLNILDWAPNIEYIFAEIIKFDKGYYQCKQAHRSGTTFDLQYWASIKKPEDPADLEVVKYTEASNTITEIPYGTEYTTQQDVFNFLMDYERYLISQGFIFDKIIDNDTLDWTNVGKQFLSWTLTKWQPGAFITLSPFNRYVKFNSAFGSIQSLEKIDNGLYNILNEEGRIIQPKDTQVFRFDNQLEIIPTDVDQTQIYFVRLYLSEIEHVFTVNNKTIFDDLIYNPILNVRQDRLRLSTIRTKDWRGRYEAPGFFITDNRIVANFEKSVEDFRHYFDIENPVNDKILNKFAKHDIAYQNRDYLEEMLILNKSEFNFYQGMIKDKGTPNSLERPLRSNFLTKNIDFNFYEEWAFRTGQFGGVGVNPSIEILLKQKDIKQKPQLIDFEKRTFQSWDFFFWDSYSYDPDVSYAKSLTKSDWDALFQKYYPDDPFDDVVSVYTLFSPDVPENYNSESTIDLYASQFNFKVITLNDRAQLFTDGTITLNQTVFVEESLKAFKLTSLSPVWSEIANAKKISTGAQTIEKTVNTLTDRDLLVVGTDVQINDTILVSNDLSVYKVISNNLNPALRFEFLFHAWYELDISFENISYTEKPDEIISGDSRWLRKPDSTQSSVDNFIWPLIDTSFEFTNGNVGFDITNFDNAIWDDSFRDEYYKKVNKKYFPNAGYVHLNEYTFSLFSKEQIADLYNALVSQNIYFRPTNKIWCYNSGNTGDFPFDWTVYRITKPDFAFVNSQPTTFNNITNAVRVKTDRAHKLKVGDYLILNKLSPQHVGKGVFQILSVSEDTFVITDATLATQFYDFTNNPDIKSEILILLEVRCKTINDFYNKQGVINALIYDYVDENEKFWVDDARTQAQRNRKINPFWKTINSTYVPFAWDDFRTDEIITYDIKALIKNYRGYTDSQLSKYQVGPSVKFGVNDIDTGWDYGEIDSCDDLGISFINPKANTIECFKIPVAWDEIGPYYQSIREENKQVDTSLLENAVIYNKRFNLIEKTLQIFDPYKGLIPGIAEREIEYITDYDPAKYTSGNPSIHQIDSDQAWSKLQIGQVWWDLRTVKYINYEIDSEEYRRQNWGKTAPGSSIDVYEWTRSTLKPDVYQSSTTNDINDVENDEIPTGTVYALFSPAYTETIEWDSYTSTYQTFYYYWVKNKLTIPKLNFRKLSTKQIAQIILNPTAQNIPWFSPIDENKLIVTNCYEVLNDTDTVLQVNWSKTKEKQNIHNQFIIQRENDDSFIIDTTLFDKMTDSLVGYDLDNLILPCPTLTEIEKYGNLFRPRQTWFKDKYKAREDFILLLNIIFKTYNLDDKNNKIKDILKLNDPYPTSYDFIANNIAQRDFLKDSNSLIQGNTVLVKENTDTNNLWTLWKFNNNSFDLIDYQTYNINDFIEYVDYVSSEDLRSPTKRYKNINLAKREYVNGYILTDEIVKINDDGTGKWIWIKFTGVFSTFNVQIGTNDPLYNIVSKKNNSLQFKSIFYENSYVFGIDKNITNLEDLVKYSKVRDGSLELRNILQNIYTFIDNKDVNKLFFNAVHYAHSEQLMIDWAFKTSFLYISGNGQKLLQNYVKAPDITTPFLNYINEIKPYHVKIRDFASKFSSNIDEAKLYITDFDKPPYSTIDENGNTVVRILNENNSDDLAILNTRPWKDWLNNKDLTRHMTISMKYDRTSCFENDLEPVKYNITTDGVSNKWILQSNQIDIFTDFPSLENHVANKLFSKDNIENVYLKDIFNSEVKIIKDYKIVEIFDSGFLDYFNYDTDKFDTFIKYSIELNFIPEKDLILQVERRLNAASRIEKYYNPIKTLYNGKPIIDPAPNNNLLKYCTYEGRIIIGNYLQNSFYKPFELTNVTENNLLQTYWDYNNTISSQIQDPLVLSYSWDTFLYDGVTINNKSYELPTWLSEDSLLLDNIISSGKTQNSSFFRFIGDGVTKSFTVGTTITDIIRIKVWVNNQLCENILTKNIHRTGVYDYQIIGNSIIFKDAPPPYVDAHASAYNIFIMIAEEPDTFEFTLNPWEPIIEGRNFNSYYTGKDRPEELVNLNVKEPFKLDVYTKAYPGSPIIIRNNIKGNGSIGPYNIFNNAQSYEAIFVHKNGQLLLNKKEFDKIIALYPHGDYLLPSTYTIDWNNNTIIFDQPVLSNDQITITSWTIGGKSINSDTLYIDGGSQYYNVSNEYTNSNVFVTVDGNIVPFNISNGILDFSYVIPNTSLITITLFEGDNICVIRTDEFIGDKDNLTPLNGLLPTFYGNNNGTNYKLKQKSENYFPEWANTIVYKNNYRLCGPETKYHIANGVNNCFSYNIETDNPNKIGVWVNGIAKEFYNPSVLETINEAGFNYQKYIDYNLEGFDIFNYDTNSWDFLATTFDKSWIKSDLFNNIYFEVQFSIIDTNDIVLFNKIVNIYDYDNDGIVSTQDYYESLINDVDISNNNVVVSYIHDNLIIETTNNNKVVFTDVNGSPLVSAMFGHEYPYIISLATPTLNLGESLLSPKLFDPSIEYTNTTSNNSGFDLFNFDEVLWDEFNGGFDVLNFDEDLWDSYVVVVPLVLLFDITIIQNGITYSETVTLQAPNVGFDVLNFDETIWDRTNSILSDDLLYALEYSQFLQDHNINVVKTNNKILIYTGPDTHITLTDITPNGAIQFFYGYSSVSSTIKVLPPGETIYPEIIVGVNNIPVTVKLYDFNGDGLIDIFDFANSINFHPYLKNKQVYAEILANTVVAIRSSINSFVEIYDDHNIVDKLFGSWQFTYGANKIAKYDTRICLKETNYYEGWDIVSQIDATILEDFFNLYGENYDYEIFNEYINHNNSDSWDNFIWDDVIQALNAPPVGSKIVIGVFNGHDYEVSGDVITILANVDPTDRITVLNMNRNDVVKIHTEKYQGNMTSEYRLFDKRFQNNSYWVDINGVNKILNKDFIIIEREEFYDEFNWDYLPEEGFDNSSNIVSYIKFNEPLDLSKEICITYFVGKEYKPAVAFSMFRDPYGRKTAFRISDSNKTYLYTDLNIDDDSFEVLDNDRIKDCFKEQQILSIPDKSTNTPGVVWINNERILYWNIEELVPVDGARRFKLSDLLRGTKQTTFGVTQNSIVKNYTIDNVSLQYQLPTNISKYDRIIVQKLTNDSSKSTYDNDYAKSLDAFAWGSEVEIQYQDFTLVENVDYYIEGGYVKFFKPIMSFGNNDVNNLRIIVIEYDWNTTQQYDINTGHMVFTDVNVNKITHKKGTAVIDGNKNQIIPGGYNWVWNINEKEAVYDWREEYKKYSNKFTSKLYDDVIFKNFQFNAFDKFIKSKFEATISDSGVQNYKSSALRYNNYNRNHGIQFNDDIMTQFLLNKPGTDK